MERQVRAGWAGTLIPWDVNDSSVRSGMFIEMRPRNASLRLRQERHVSPLDCAIPTCRS